MICYVVNLEDKSIVLFCKDVLIFLLRNTITTELSTDNLDMCTLCQMAVLEHPPFYRCFRTFSQIVPQLLISESSRNTRKSSASKGGRNYHCWNTFLPHGVGNPLLTIDTYFQLNT